MSIYFVPVQIWFPLQSKKYKKKEGFFLYFFVRLLVLTFVWQSALRHTSLWSFYFVFLFRFKKNCTFFLLFQVFDSVKIQFIWLGKTWCLFSWLENKCQTQDEKYFLRYSEMMRTRRSTHFGWVWCSPRQPPPICQPPTCI